MRVRDLIELLKELPEDATIGTFDQQYGCIYSSVSILNKDDVVYSSGGESVSIEELENCRYSNEDNICDYYIN